MVQRFLNRTLEPCKKALQRCQRDSFANRRGGPGGRARRGFRACRRWCASFSAGAAQRVNPDEVVAIGAAVQAACWAASQGRAAAGRDAAFAGHRDAGRGLYEVDRPEHHHSQLRKSEIFSTAAENQTSVEIKVLTRVSAPWPGTTACWRVPSWATSRRRPRGVPQNREGDLRHRRQRHLNVTAKDRATSNEQKITITSSSA